MLLTFDYSAKVYTHNDCFYLKRLKSDKVTEKGEIRQFMPVLHCIGSNKGREVVLVDE